MHRLAYQLAALTLVLSVTGLRWDSPGGHKDPGEGPRLVLFVIIDQAGHDFLVESRPRFRYGLRRLFEESVQFEAAKHHHATTKTAPGHATLATGVHPSRHGIVDNVWFDRRYGRTLRAVSDPGSARSANNLEATTLGTWMKRADPLTKVFAVAGKARSAFMLAGDQADGVVWLDGSLGGLVASGACEGAVWLGQLGAQQYAEVAEGLSWQPLEMAAGQAGFSHRLTGGGGAEGSGVPWDESPRLDAYVERAALALLDAGQLGQGAHPDLLSISFSALDEVGHRFGPDSAEAEDTLLRLDRSLGRILEAADRLVGSERVLLSVSSDHGVMRSADTLSRPQAEDDCLEGVHEAVKRRLGDEDWLRADLSVDASVLARTGVSRSAVEDAAKSHLEACPVVERVWTRTELVSADPVDDPWLPYWLHVLHPERGPDVFVQHHKGTFLPERGAAAHGSPYRYDTHVPWLIRLPSGRHQVISEPVWTVDVAPTLAGLLGVPVLADVDGQDRRSLLEGAVGEVARNEGLESHAARP